MRLKEQIFNQAKTAELLRMTTALLYLGYKEYEIRLENIRTHDEKCYICLLHPVILSPRMLSTALVIIFLMLKDP